MLCTDNEASLLAVSMFRPRSAFSHQKLTCEIQQAWTFHKYCIIGNEVKTAISVNHSCYARWEELQIRIIPFTLDVGMVGARLEARYLGD